MDFALETIERSRVGGGQRRSVGASASGSERLHGERQRAMGWPRGNKRVHEEKDGEGRVLGKKKASGCVEMPRGIASGGR